MTMGNQRNAGTGDAFKVHGEAGTRTPRRSPHRAQPVTSTRLHPAAEALALFLAGGDRSRLVIISATEVDVVNRPRGGTR